MQLTKRAFLQFIPGAAVATPVIAKEAASKMALASAIEVPKGGVDKNVLNALVGSDSYPEPEFDYFERLKKILEQLKLGKLTSYEERELRNASRVLDPDLAASRSISPTAAYQIQVDRNRRTMISNRTKEIEKDLKEAAKQAVGISRGDAKVMQIGPGDF